MDYSIHYRKALALTLTSAKNKSCDWFLLIRRVILLKEIPKDKGIPAPADGLTFKASSRRDT